MNGQVIYPKEYEEEMRKRRRSKSSTPQDCRPVKRIRYNRGCTNSPQTVYVKEYVVEKILAHKYRGGKHTFLVKWKGWSEEENTWEPISHLQNCTELLEEFLTDSLSQHVLQSLKEKLNLAPKISRAHLESLIPYDGFEALPPKTQIQKKLLVYAATADDVDNKINKAKETLLLYLLYLKREVQLINLTDWEISMNKACSEDAFIKVENKYDLEGPPKGFVYINKCLKMPGIIIPDDPPLGCECVECGPRNKKCCGNQQSRAYNYRGRRRINLPPGIPIYECNKRCKCNSDCPNRTVQSGRKVPLCIYRTNNGCGWGVKALRKIFKGEFVSEYVGEIITHEEAERRGKIYDARGRTYLFDLDFNSSDNPYTIDAATYGNVSHFINHSCEPNLAVWAIWIDCLDPNLPSLALFALREIEKDEELTFDYMSSNGGNTPEKNSLETESGSEVVDSGVNYKKKSLCKCGTKSCRRYLF